MKCSAKMMKWYTWPTEHTRDSRREMHVITDSLEAQIYQKKLSLKISVQVHLSGKLIIIEFSQLSADNTLAADRLCSSLYEQRWMKETVMMMMMLCSSGVWQTELQPAVSASLCSSGAADLCELPSDIRESCHRFTEILRTGQVRRRPGLAVQQLCVWSVSERACDVVFPESRQMMNACCWDAEPLIRRHSRPSRRLTVSSGWIQWMIPPIMCCLEIRHTVGSEVCRDKHVFLPGM